MGRGIFQKVGILKIKGNHIKKVGIMEMAIIGAIVLTFLPMCENDTTYGVVEASLAALYADNDLFMLDFGHG